MADRILETCPDAEWRLIFALMRFGGLRCPSEVQALKWSDVNWERDRFLIHSIKTEHIDGKQTRWCPLFPELRSHFEACFDAAEDGEQFVISKRHCMTHRGLTAQYRQILHHAAVPEYPKLFQNLRSTRQTELAEKFSLHVVTAWIGNSRDVALKHYLQVTDEHFEQAAKSERVVAEATELAQKAAQHSQAS
ncbi:MAG: site-specific integrase [Planctomycetota bacterium]|nr:site-specific integrase [Planctomycetota bacterium]